MVSEKRIIAVQSEQIVWIEAYMDKSIKTSGEKMME